MRIVYSFQQKTIVRNFEAVQVIIGRPRAGLEVDLDLTPDEKVSCPHALICFHNGAYWIEDLNSRLGTQVNGREIKGEGKQQLQPDDSIQIGETRLQMEIPSLIGEVLSYPFPLEDQKNFDDSSKAEPFKVKGTARIFLSYARPDEERVKQLYQKLAEAGCQPWMDRKDILPGERWRPSIKSAIRDSNFFLVCLSQNSIKREDFIQREIDDALDVLYGKSTGDFCLIPVRLEACEVPERLSDLQWVDLFAEDGWEKLVKAIQLGIEGSINPVGEITQSMNGSHSSHVSMEAASRATQHQPYVHNPFTWRNGITAAEDFFNREDEQFTLRDYLHNRQNCQIVGPRRIGKTSLLLHIERILQEWNETAVIAYIDMHDARCYELSGWLGRVSQKFSWAPPATTLGEFNARIEEMVSRNVLPILCLDEFEEFTMRRDEFSRDFFLNLRWNGSQRMAIITASQKELNELTDPDDPSSPFYNIFPTLKLGPFDADDVHDFLSLLRPNMPPFEQAEKEAIQAFAKGYPLALQVACFHVLNSKRSGKSLAIAFEKAKEDLKSYSSSDARFLGYAKG